MGLEDRECSGMENRYCLLLYNYVLFEFFYWSCITLNIEK